METQDEVAHLNLPHFLLESSNWMSDDDPLGLITQAHKCQATYNAIHQAIQHWDQAALDPTHDGHIQERKITVSRSLRVFSGCLLLQERPDVDEPDYGRVSFTQRFWGYLLYQVSTHGGFACIESIGVNPDCRRQGFARRLIGRFNIMHRKAILCSLVPDTALELCNLLKHANCRCEREKGYFTFSWRA